ncbi:MAG: hypothetical protein PVF66_05480 [Candidatus Aminicenantes bacterium]|jgi:hypothetical protein
MRRNYLGKDIERYARALGEHRDDIRRLLDFANNNPDKLGRVKQELQYKIRKENRDPLDLSPFPPLNPKDRLEDGISISDVVVKDRALEEFVEPPDNYISGNFLDVGSIGSGKSRVVKMIFHSNTRNGIPVLLSDSHLEHTDILNFFEPDEVLLINPLGLFHQLLMPPPGCSMDVWMGVINALIRDALFMRDASINRLNRIIEYLRSRGNPCPSISEIYNFALNQKIPFQNLRRIQHHETTLNRTGSLRKTSFDGHKSHRLEAIVEKSSIIETGKIFDPGYLRLFINFLLAWLMVFREFNPSQGTKNILILEEAHDFYLSNKIDRRSDLSEPFIYTIPREMRKRNFSIGFVCHSPKLMPIHVLSTISDFFIFNLPNISDIPYVALPAGLTEEEIEELPNLKNRQCVRKARWASQAYLTQIKKFDTHHAEPGLIEEFRKETLKALSPVRTSIVFNVDDSEEVGESEHPDEKAGWRFRVLSSQSKGFVSDCIKFPADNRKKRQKRLGHGNWELAKMVSWLSRNNLIKPHWISWGKPGSSEIIDEATEEGFKFVGKKYVPLCGKGSFYHRIIQLKLSESLKNVVIEYNGADCAWIKPSGVTFALEIELSPESPHILTNIRRDLSIPGPRGFLFSAVWIVCVNKKDMEKISYMVKESLEPKLLDKVEFKLLRDLI